MFTQWAWLLLAPPALAATGRLLWVFAAEFPPMRKGFYGLRVTLLTGVFLALLREPRAEGAARVPRRTWAGSWGWIGPGRSRRSGASSPSSPATGGARRCRPRWPVTTPLLYVDGHVRVHSGTR